MKKVLSVLLAAAMVMGMSVSAMADQVWGNGPKGHDNEVDIRTLSFDEWMYVDYNDDGHEWVLANQEDEDKFIFHPEDVAYFAIMQDTPAISYEWEYVGVKNGHEAYADWYKEGKVEKPTVAAEAKHVGGNYTFNKTGAADAADGSFLWTAKEVKDYTYYGSIDKDWAIYLNDDSSFIKSAEFAAPNGKLTDTVTAKYVKVTFQASYDELEDDDCDFYLYIADKGNKTHGKDKYVSKSIAVHYLFDNWHVNYVDFDFMNDVDYDDTKWVVETNTRGTAAFSFEELAYFVVKMNPEEEVLFNFTSAYDKDLDKAYGYDAEFDFYNFKGTKDEFARVGELVIPAADDTFVYEVVDGKAVEVEAEYVEDYEVLKGTKVDGWVIETNELGYYVVSDIELEIEAEEEVEAEVEAEKANPETGAADFVGAAVAMAVVSVAAAGALALKK